MRHTWQTALLLFIAALIACAATTGTSVLTDKASAVQRDASDTFERWTDWHEADQAGEGLAYLRAVSAAAQELENLDESELDRRLKALVEPLAEESRWRVFYKTPQVHDCLRTLPWHRVKAEQSKFEFLLSSSLAELNLSLEPDAPATRKREAIILIERELPVIRSLRLDLIESILTDVYETQAILSGAERFEHLRPLLNE